MAGLLSSLGKAVAKAAAKAASPDQAVALLAGLRGGHPGRSTLPAVDELQGIDPQVHVMPKAFQLIACCILQRTSSSSLLLMHVATRCTKFMCTETTM